MTVGCPEVLRERVTDRDPREKAASISFEIGSRSCECRIRSPGCTRVPAALVGTSSPKHHRRTMPGLLISGYSSELARPNVRVLKYWGEYFNDARGAAYSSNRIGELREVVNSVNEDGCMLRAQDLRYYFSHNDHGRVIASKPPDAQRGGRA